TPQMQVDLFPRSSGYLERILVHLGDSVRQGQTIAQIDRTDYLQKVRETEARVAQAKAQLTEIEAGARAEELRQAEEAVKGAQSRFENARLHRERIEALFKRQVISKKEMDTSEMEYTVAEAQLASSGEHLKLLREGARQEVREASQARLKETEAILAQERIRLQHTQIIAPFSGEISRKYVDAGALVSPSTPIVNLIHTETIKVVANVLEKDIPLLKAGMKAKIRTESFPGKIFEGRIVRISSALDPATRTLQAEIEVPNPGRLLKPSMYARIDLVLLEKPHALVIPRYAVVLSDGSKAIFILKGNQAIRRPVVTGYEQDQYVEILEGASEGDQVIVKGQELIKDRSTVRVIEGS
ncbi:MAG: efflux RND transporter periplasmic adaptor subunit, partial [Deltaproteobacteria bacterium]|nr:efflux RND transporter periplasmic adaptor subunit [Deltaproteobacteria bacterium]